KSSIVVAATRSDILWQSPLALPLSPSRLSPLFPLSLFFSSLSPFPLPLSPPLPSPPPSPSLSPLSSLLPPPLFSFFSSPLLSL
ncbi:hypothetical protein ACXWRW_10775, partial [Streptococcus pyogenes]